MTSEEMARIIEEYESMIAYELTVAGDLKKGNPAGHEYGEANADYREGYAHGLQQAVDMLRKYPGEK